MTSKEPFMLNALAKWHHHGKADTLDTQDQIHVHFVKAF